MLINRTRRQMLEIILCKKAQCIGMPNLFFPAESERPRAKEKREKVAKDICETCSVVSQCLDYGNANKEHGIWGGLNEVERVVKPFASTNSRSFIKIAKQ